MVDYLTQIGLPLLGIIGLILILGLLGKHLNPSRSHGNSPIKILATVAVSRQVKICLVEVGEQQLLLSISGQQATCLHTLPERLPESAIAASQEFSTLMHSLLSTKNNQ